MNDTQTEDRPAGTQTQGEQGTMPERGISQYDLALRRLRERGCAVDPEGPVGEFGSAF